VWLGDGFCPLGVVVAGSNVVIKFLWTKLPDRKSLCVVSKLLGRTILTGAESTELASKSKAVWSTWRFTADVDLYNTGFSLSLSSFRGIMTWANIVVKLFKSLLADRERLCIVTELGVSHG
jgi:hypothetical protein